MVAYAGGTAYPRATGYISKYGPDGFGLQDWTSIQLEAYDALKAAQDADITSSFLGMAYLALNPVFWYRCQEQTNAASPNPGADPLTAVDSSGNGNAGRYAGVTGNATTSSGTSSGYGLVAEQLTLSAAGIPVLTSGTWSLPLIVNLTDTTSTSSTASTAVSGPTSAAPMPVVGHFQGHGGWSVTVEWQPGDKSYSLCFHCYDGAGTLIGSILGDITNGGWVKPGVDHFVTVEHDGTTATLRLDGRTIGTCTTSGAAFPAVPAIVMGAAGPGNVTYQTLIGGVGDITLVPTAISDGQYADLYAFFYKTSRTTGEWINAVLDQVGPSCADRAIAAGLTSLVEPDPGDTAKARTSLEQTANDELGLLYVAKNGTVTFRDRHWAITAPNRAPKCTFGTSAGAIPLTDIAFAPNDQDLWSGVTAARTGGTNVTFVSPSAGSIAGRTGGYGKKTLEFPTSLNVGSDAELRGLVAWLGGKYAKEQVRVSSLTVTPWVPKVGTDLEAWQDVLALELWDTVALYLSAGPGLSGVLALTLLIEGITDTYDFETGEGSITFQTTPADTTHYWIAGDPTYGCELTYPLAY